MYTYIHTCYLCIHVYVYMYTYIHTYVYMYINICIRIYIHIYIYIRIFIYIRMYMYTYMYTHIHIYTYLWIYVLTFFFGKVARRDTAPENSFRVTKTIRCPELQVIFRKRAHNYKAPMRKMTYKDKASYGFLPPFTAKYQHMDLHMWFETSLLHSVRLVSLVFVVFSIFILFIFA